MSVCWEPENFLRQSVLGWPLLAVQKRAFGAFNPTTSPTPTGLHYWEDRRRGIYFKTHQGAGEVV